MSECLDCFCYRAVNSPDPLIRMKTIVKFYLSGFYKKPKVSRREIFI